MEIIFENLKKDITALKDEVGKLHREVEGFRDLYENLKVKNAQKKQLSFKQDEIQQSLLQKQFNKIVKADKKSKLSEQVFCAIGNYNCNENALNLLSCFSRYFDTAILDSSSQEKNENFILLDNQFYSGLLNNAYQCALEKGFKYLLFICSDVVCEANEIDKMIGTLNGLDLSQIGIYSPSSKGRSHAYCKQRHKGGLRSVPFVEGFMFLADMNVLKNIVPVDLNINLYGWGLDVAKGYFCRKFKKLCLIDDGVSVFHPGDQGYSSELAEHNMWQWIDTFHDGAFREFYTKQIDIIRKGQAGLNKVSVIVPCYNVEAYLEETIISILLQEHGNIEIIIINDGSKDGTEKIAKTLKNKYSDIRYLSIKNGGLGNARNEGLKMATGDFVQFLDSDDLLSTNKIVNQVYDFILHPETDVSYSDYLCFEDGNPAKTWTYSRWVLKDDAVLDFIENWETDLSIPVHCFLLKRSFIDGILFDLELPNHEDWEFHLRVASKRPKYLYQPNGIAYYRVRHKSMTGDRELMTRGKKMCIQKTIDSGKFHGYYLEALKNRLQEN